MDQLGYLLHRAVRSLDQEFAVRLREVGLTPRQASVLLTLSRDEPSTPTQLSEKLGIDRATMSGLVARLARGGWIEVRDNPADGRSQSLSLTARTRDALPRIREASGQAQTRVLGGMERGDVESLLRSLRVLVEGESAESEGSRSS